MEVEFYNRDARDVFLSPKSVDLFLVHPPYFSMKDDERYGGDSTLQVQHVIELEDFSNALIEYVNNMADALKDEGNILLIVPNFYEGIIAIADVLKGTNLFIDRILIWNIVKKIKGQDQPLINLILQIRKNKDSKYKIKGLDSLIINQEWTLDDVVKYQNMGFVGDAFPIEIADILINAFSEEGDTVADLFGGTGTTAISSLKNNRKPIYNDASIDQFNLAKKRVYDTLRVIPDEERQENMIKDEVVKIMLDSVNNDNRGLCKQGGMNDTDTEAQIAQSQPSLMLICSNLYDVLKQKEIIA
jgi:DNA modification methylase